MMTRRLFPSLVLIASLFVASSARAEEKLKVVASFSILSDFVRNVGGERIALTTLVGPDGDAHVFQPKAADGKKLAEAKVVFVNGLGFEGWMERLVKASGTKARVITATMGVTPLKAEEEEHDHKHDHEAVDPHAWQSIANAKIYVANIRDGLIGADPAGKAAYEANASAYLAKLEALEAEITAALAKIPAGQRQIITSHDAFGYFGTAYGLEFVAPQGVSTEAEATAKQVAKLIGQIKKTGAKAVFVENINDPRLIKRIADETGAKIGGTLFSDALSKDTGGAPTYIDMMRNNAKALVDALEIKS